MSFTAQKRDISDPEVIQQFCSIVDSPLKLSALYLLTVADILGTNPKIWSTWKARLLKTLYEIALRKLQSKEIEQDVLLTFNQRKALQVLNQKGIDKDLRNRFWAQMDDAYFLRHEIDELIWHAEHLYNRMDSTASFVKARYVEQQNTIQIMVYTRDSAFLFEKIAVFFYHNHMNIIESQFHTTTNAHVLDTLFINPQGSEVSIEKNIRFIEEHLSAFLDNKDSVAYNPQDPRNIITHRSTRRSQTFPIPPKVSLDSDEPGQGWRLQITTDDSAAFLFVISRLFREHDINLQFARILTYGERLESVFIIEGAVLKNSRLQIPFERAIIESLQHLSPINDLNA